MENLRDFIDVVVKEKGFLFGKKLTINIREKQHLPGAKYRIKVMHDKAVVYNSGFSKRKNYVYFVNKTGSWIIFADAEVKGRSFNHIRESIWTYSKQQKQDYRDFLNTPYTTTASELPLAKLRDPYRNTALICSSQEKMRDLNLKSFVETTDKSLYMYSNGICAGGVQLSFSVISQEKHKETDDGCLWFSGKTKFDRKLVFGQDDISEETDIDKLLDEVGYFSAIFFNANKNELIFTTDYFGMYPIYSYEDDEITVVSNSFHMLILILKHAGVRLKLDIGHTVPYFTCGERMLFEQLASHKTLVSGIEKVPIHSKYVLSEKGFRRADKSIAEALRNPLPYDEINYKNLLREYADEIVQNVQTAREDARFDDLILDVSGGKDSRVILSAAMKAAPNGDPKIKINSVDVPVKKDKDSFIPLNYVHPFEYDDHGAILKTKDVEKDALRQRSAFLGTQFRYMLPWKYERTTEKPSVLQLTGAGGDMLLCAYFPMSFTQLSYKDTDSLLESFAYLYNNGTVNFEKICPYVKTLVSDGLSEVIGNDLYEKVNNYYLYFRNSYHFGPEAAYSCMENEKEQWFPLLSKKGFVIRQMISHKFKGIKFSIDLINCLAPSLLKIPFNDPKYNREVTEIINKDPELKKNLDKLKIEINKDDTEWKDAQKERERKRKIVSDTEERENVNLQEKRFVENIYYDATDKLKKILNYNEELEETVGLDLFIKFSENKDYLLHNRPSNDFYFMYNKINALSDLIDIIESDRSEM